MAVLDLLLAGNTLARAIPELAGVVTTHDSWLGGRKFLMVPYHMIGARDVESAIMGGYAEHVRRLHPTAPVPGFYLGERLFDDARSLRAEFGDELFFARLNAGKEAVGDGWGDLGAAWDTDRFASAMLEGPEGEERQRLVGDLISTYFRSYADVAAARGEAFVDLDTGLAIMSQHAKALGYDAVVLFLDELILWLATRAGDVDFVSAEGAKLSKLVEAQNVQRPIPIVSFVARQRDLRELIGEHQAGALEVRFIDTLKYWEARFDKVTLEDRNLPVIAERRLLKPTSATARDQIDAAFDEFAGKRKDVLETLLGSDGERELFRKTYPFSPALVQALIAASSVLQRERTALKLMLTLLVKRRDELRLGSLIPVGDLWDEIAAGDQPFSDGMKIQFDNAKKLWTQKLLPMLEQTHGLAWQDLQDGRADATVARRFQNDARLLKTLLLAALVPEVPALRALTAPRLAALNHGSVLSPVPGQEGGIVLQKLRGWAARVGEIHITENSNPTISIQITGVDIPPILANAAQFDNDGTRRSRLQKILFEALGIADDGSLLGAQPFVEYRYPWRGTVRLVDLYFEVVLELPYDRLRGRPGAPVLVMGMPFDPKNRPPADQRAHAVNFSDDTGAGGVVWQPSYLSDRALKELGTLVRIDHLLAGDRLNAAASMLSLSDREQARAVLKSQQSALHQRLRACLEAAYGIRPDNDGCVGTALPSEDRLISLDTFRPQMPVGATMKEAVGKLLDSLFTDRYPAHPNFEQEVRPPALRRVLEEVQRAALQSDQRQLIEEHPVRRILAALAGPLKLGQMGQTHFVLSDHWASHFARMQAQAGSAPLTVGRLRTWIDVPRAMGLITEVQNLVILAFAAQADRSLVRHGTPATLQWTLDPARLQQFLILSDEARNAVSEHVVDPAGLVVLRSARSGRGADALAIGLVCGVLFADEITSPELRDAAVRLEPALGNTAIAPDAGRALAAAARIVLRDLFATDPATARTVQAQASTLLGDIRADGFAARSPALDMGLEARIRDAGVALGDVAAAGTMDEAKRAWAVVRRAREHDRAPDQQARIDRLTMAARLAMWLAASRQSSPASFQAACRAFAQDGAFVDWARSVCGSGDPIAAVAAAYARLRALATRRREAENQAFAGFLAQWNGGGAFGTEPVPIERVLEQVAVPIGRDVPLLVLVLDGLSVPIWRDLADSVARLGWFEMWPVGHVAPLVAVAALPSVTEISRASLLCGTLTRGDQAAERAGFATHSGLLGISRAGKPPRLFHKADLGGGPELEQAVRDALGDPHQRVVGIVHNAIDAQLSGSDQLDINWSTESLRQVLSVLRFARDANRIVLVVGDHGHVIEAGTTQTGNWGSDRWRAPGPAGAGEIALAGGRVVSPGGGTAIVAAWSEQVRYSSKRAGYHGGVSPQEMLVPIGILAARQAPAGWDRAPPSEPSWWRGLDEIAATAAASEQTSIPAWTPVPKQKQADRRQAELFVAPPVPAVSWQAAASVPMPAAASPPAWIAELLGSESYAAQRRLAGRGAPTDEQVAAVLMALSIRGGRLSRATLAQSMALPLLRVGGVVSASRRVLNLDQAQVLREEGDEVVFNEHLARTQFGLRTA